VPDATPPDRPTRRPWADRSLPVEDRVELLLAEMTLQEKLAQLGSARPTAGSVIAAPGEDTFAAEQSEYAEATQHGIGQLTRVLGTAPIEPADGARRLLQLQEDLVERTRLGIPAIAHEECLSGFTTYRATIFPTPLAWAASFDADLVGEMAAAIGRSMAAVGVHQGLAPVLDVVRDYRWGRVEETLGEDPFLVGSLATAYVAGLQSGGVLATLKHFAGYSASTAGRNNAPVSMGLRELEDVILLPFEMAVRLGGARSVMHAYNEIDGIPAAANGWLLQKTLRERWGFDGIVVSDYWGIPFLATTHRVAADDAGAARLALEAGVDVELPGTRAYGQPLAELVQSGHVSTSLVDRSVRRVLAEKCRLGLLDDQPRLGPPADSADVDLDPPASRDIARRLAQESIVLADNDGTLPLAPGASRISVVGPTADDVAALFGCYAFPQHVLDRYPGHDIGIAATSVLDALRNTFGAAVIGHATGCTVSDQDRGGFPEAVRLAEDSDICILVLGDRSGLFGKGTSGEGCDVESLELPGVQHELAEAVLATGTRVVLVLLAGRPYALGDIAPRCAAVLVTFFPGEEGAAAIVDVISGGVSPSGKLPVQIPARPGGGPATYLHPPLGGRSDGISNLDPTPLYPFGHGLSYTTFEASDLAVEPSLIEVDGVVRVSVTVTNSGHLPGAEVVQVYLADPVAEVTRPVRQLIGVARVHLDPGRSARVDFAIHTDQMSFCGRDMQRIVEPGEVELHVGPSSEQAWAVRTVRLIGERRQVGPDRALIPRIDIHDA